MQHQTTHRNSRFFLTSMLLAIAILGFGCESGTYRAANLPPALMAPAAFNLDAVNLSGLANSSVSVEVIQPGDVLEVSMVSDFAKLATTTTSVRVADDGMVVVPLVGKVCVGGMEIKQAEQTINAESITRGLFRNPCITLTMKQCRTSKVTVAGAVMKPGTYDLPRGSGSVMAALIAAEGLSKEAGTIVEIRHTDSRQAASGVPSPSQAAGGPADATVAASYQQPSPNAAMPTVTTVDLTAAAAGGVHVPELHDGDVVNVSKRTLLPIHVIGLVQKQGEYTYPTNQEIHVLDALALAGGVSNPVAEDIVVIRQMPGAPKPVRITVSLQAAKNGRDNLTLAPGDTVTVEQTPLTAVVGVLQTFIHFGLGATVPLF